MPKTMISTHASPLFNCMGDKFALSRLCDTTYCGYCQIHIVRWIRVFSMDCLIVYNTVYRLQLATCFLGRFTANTGTKGFPLGVKHLASKGFPIVSEAGSVIVRVFNPTGTSDPPERADPREIALYRSNDRRYFHNFAP